MLVKFINTLLIVIYAIGGTLALYWLLNKFTRLFRGKWEERIKPYVFILPAFLAIAVYLIYPTLQTIVWSFANSDSTAWVGLDNYKALFSSRDFIENTLVNQLLWLIFAPAATVVVGLLIAVLSDKLRPRAEKLSKTLIFMPMAVSAVGAGTVWRLMYDNRPAESPQVGLLNAIVTGLGGDPVPWLQTGTLRANTFLLMVIFLWMQIGFSMVLLSSAIKGVPNDTLEAARIDGAGEVAVFFRIVVPQIAGTILTVFILVTISVMKIFDIVYVMTGGNYKTKVVAVDFFNQMFTNFNNGTGAAIVVLLLIAITPILVFQVRQARKEGVGR